ncbi:alanine racemase [Granulibacter bethesdensis]|uniref:alanine racemase n=1 Tax=Granulibacter bethesdensis TaxID=364410 RepID=UPI0030018599
MARTSDDIGPYEMPLTEAEASRGPVDILPSLQGEAHQNGPGVARLEIDLEAIAANWRFLRTTHGTNRITGAVVKADGYGLGAAVIAQRLVQEGCDHIFVAHPQEALTLRPLIPSATLIVLNGLWPGWEAVYADHGLIPALGSLAEIEAWRQEATRREQALPAFLHVDTGINRLGLDPQERDRLAERPELLDGITLRAIMTHLISAEIPDHDSNTLQRQRFAAACSRLPPAPRSIANSSGIFLGPDFASDIARPGAALYGINPLPGRPNPMRPVLRLSARVLQIRPVEPGEIVGYNGIWTAQRPSRIAVCSVGYADGFQRALSSRAEAAFDGARIPLVGRVSMDLTTYDVTDDPRITVGSWLELIGPEVSPDEVAARASTNGYEVLTSLGRRYERIYRPLTP